MGQHEHVFESLGYFKDWTNYLLITTVAALGWVAKTDVSLGPLSRRLTIVFFCFSIIFAILTLALIPIVGESIDPNTKSFYGVPATFDLLPSWWPFQWEWGRNNTAWLKWACWPQHVLFLLGILTFSFGSILNVQRPSQNAG